MGYTHYIQWDKLPSPVRIHPFQKALNEMGSYLKKISHVRYEDLPLIGPVIFKNRYFEKGYEEEFVQAGSPIIWYDDNNDVRAICFNGSRNKKKEYDDTFEDFTLFREEIRYGKTNYCKTGRRKYDHVIVGCLTILAHYIPGIVKTDGCADDWEPGVQALNKIMETDYKNPFGIPEPTYLDALLSVANVINTNVTGISNPNKVDTRPSDFDAPIRQQSGRKKIQIQASICVPETPLTQSLIFDWDYSEHSTILDLKYRLLALARTELTEKNKKFFTTLQDIGVLSDRGVLFEKMEKTQEYFDDELIDDCIKKNSGTAIINSHAYRLGAKLGGGASYAANLPTSALFLQNDPPAIQKILKQNPEKIPPAKRQKTNETSDSIANNPHSLFVQPTDKAVTQSESVTTQQTPATN